MHENGRYLLFTFFQLSKPMLLLVLSLPLGTCVPAASRRCQGLCPARAQGIEQVAETVADQAQPLAQRTADFIKEQAPVVAENAVPMAERASEIAEGVAREVRSFESGACLLSVKDRRGAQA